LFFAIRDQHFLGRSRVPEVPYIPGRLLSRRNPMAFDTPPSTGHVGCFYHTLNQVNGQSELQRELNMKAKALSLTVAVFIAGIATAQAPPPPNTAEDASSAAKEAPESTQSNSPSSAP
jgi:hypothetical protein